MKFGAKILIVQWRTIVHAVSTGQLNRKEGSGTTKIHHYFSVEEVYTLIQHAYQFKVKKTII